MYDVCAFEMPLTEQIRILRSWGDDVVAVTSLIKCLSIAESRSYSKYYSLFWLFFAIGF